MHEETAGNENRIHTNKYFLIGLARAFAGAILFSFPLIMTMEMWALGFTIERCRPALFMCLAIPSLIRILGYQNP